MFNSIFTERSSITSLPYSSHTRIHHWPYGAQEPLLAPKIHCKCNSQAGYESKDVRPKGKGGEERQNSSSEISNKTRKILLLPTTKITSHLKSHVHLSFSLAFSTIQILKDCVFLKHKLCLITVSLPTVGEQGFSISACVDKDEWMDSKACMPMHQGRLEILNLALATFSGSLEGGLAIIKLSSYNKKKQNNCFPVF